MNDFQAIELVEMLAAAFPKQPMPPQTIAVYARMLRDLDHDAAETAIINLMATSTFFPAIAEIRQAVAEQQTGLSTWNDGWEEVMNAVRQYGSYIGPKWGNDGLNWSSPLVARAVAAVGYETICQSELKQLGTLRAQFRDVFEVERSRRLKEVQTGGLALDRAAAAAIGGGE